MNLSLEERKLNLIERIMSIQEPRLLEEALDYLEGIADIPAESKLSDWAHTRLMTGMADSKAGRIVAEDEVTRLIEEALHKAKKGPNAQPA